GIFNSPGLNSSKFGLRHHIPNWKLNQAFIAASGNVDGTDVFITVYAVDHDSYTLINQDVIEVGSAETGLVTVDKISKGLAATGHIAIYDIYFDIGKDTVKPTSDSALKTIADYMNSQKEMKFFIVGHTDNTGLYTNNLTLSRNRAKTVMNLLVSKFGVSESQLDADGVASLAPVASNKEEVGREKNRRVEIVLQ
ncbi:OmpA family protein, partial [bacterium]|nr:OmpA family protein [bacterium]